MLVTEVRHACEVLPFQGGAVSRGAALLRARFGRVCGQVAVHGIVREVAKGVGETRFYPLEGGRCGSLVAAVFEVPGDVEGGGARPKGRDALGSCPGVVGALVRSVCASRAPLPCFEGKLDCVC